MTRLTRGYQFCAAHRLHTPAFSADKNLELYGKCNNPWGHGHNYRVEISVTGAVNPDSGQLVSVNALDKLVQRTVLGDFDHSDLNRDIAAFGSGLVPTSENVAVEIQRRLAAAWPADFPELAGVRLWETKRNIFELTNEEQ
ncbi:MAG: 6-carboxytetrahydropterin synthase [Bryobacteraceae bacterium]